MSSFLITGCSRGLGLEIVRELSTLPSSTVSTVFATSRASSPALSEIVHESEGRVRFIPLDVTSQSSITSASQQVSDALGPSSALDVLINNAGISLHENCAPTNLNAKDLDLTFSTNVTFVHLVTSTFLPLLSRSNNNNTASGPKIVNMTSTVGSISLAKQFAMSPNPAYKISKAALNMLTAQYAEELGPKGFCVFCLSPGWLKTELGGSYADLEPEVGARQVVKIVLEAERERDNGQFRDIWIEGSELYTGKNAPW